MAPLINIYDASILTVDVEAPSKLYSNWVYVYKIKIIKCEIHYEDGSIEDCILSDALYKDGSAILLIDVPIGYHHLILKAQSGNNYRKTVFVYPERCYLPKVTGAEKALMVHLPSLKSDNNWGIGDYSDLAQLMRLCGEAYHYIGINPIHALDPVDLKRISPYSPDSRILFNELFLDVMAVAEYCENQTLLSYIEDSRFKEIVETLRSYDFIHYSKVYKIKILFLKMIYFYFRNSIRKKSFLVQSYQSFCKSRSELEKAIIRKRSIARSRHDNDEQSVAEEFEFFLQWQCHVQLSALHEPDNPKLYLDIAIGSQLKSSDQQAEPDVFYFDKSLGVPPDEFCREGQNWNTVPLCIEGLRQSKYKYFREVIRSHMKFAGMVRVDHIAGLMKRYILLYDQHDCEGIYEDIPFQEFLAVLSIESHRHSCIVVGEDLGLVPSDLRSAMQKHNILHCFVYMLENQGFFAGEIDQRRIENSLFSFSTHDLPSLAAFVENYDITLRVNLGLLSTNNAASMLRARNQERVEYFKKLSEIDIKSVNERKQYLDNLIKMHLARVHVVSLDDLLAEWIPINIPGTNKEYPNWSRKYKTTITKENIQI